MSILQAKHTEREAYRLCAIAGINLVECDVCGARFSDSMLFAWPFCAAGIPHARMDSKDQQRYAALLEKTPERAANRLAHEALKLYGPSRLSVSWESGNLPTTPSLPTVTLHKEVLKKFSDQYKIMGEFIGNVLGKRNWSLDDLITYSRRWELPNA